MVTIIEVFHKYSEKEGDKHKLKKSELKDLISKEFPAFSEVSLTHTLTHTHTQTHTLTNKHTHKHTRLPTPSLFSFPGQAGGIKALCILRRALICSVKGGGLGGEVSGCPSR